MEFSAKEKKIIGRIQRKVPLAEAPFEIIASDLGLSEPDIVSTIGDMKKRNIVRNIGGIFSPAAMGYSSALVAIEVPSEDIERAAGIINEHPGVSHNYQRGHRYNLWFTLAEESELNLQKTLSHIAEKTGARDILVLKGEKTIKIGTALNFGDESNWVAGASLDHEDAEPRPFSEMEKMVVRLLQSDLPLEHTPFHALTAREGSSITVPELLGTGLSLLRDGYMRRYAAVLRHVNAGYRANAMTAWKPDPGKGMDRVFDIFRGEPNISHLYLRTVYPVKWEYPLFAMIHARNDGELGGIIDRLARETSIREYIILRTLREFKKEKVHYFSPRFSEWRSKNL